MTEHNSLKYWTQIEHIYSSFIQMIKDVLTSSISDVDVKQQFNVMHNIVTYQYY